MIECKNENEENVKCKMLMKVCFDSKTRLFSLLLQYIAV